MTDNLPAARGKSKVSRPGAIEGRDRQLIDLMVHFGLTAVEAGKQLKIPARSARRLLSRPHVLAYLHQEKTALRSSFGPKIIHRLLALAMQDKNMNAAVGACKVIEGAPDDDRPQNTRAPARPGLVIVVQGGGGKAEAVRTIEHAAGRELVANPDDRGPLVLSDRTRGGPG